MPIGVYEVRTGFLDFAATLPLSIADRHTYLPVRRSAFHSLLPPAERASWHARLGHDLRCSHCGNESCPIPEWSRARPWSRRTIKHRSQHKSPPDRLNPPPCVRNEGIRISDDPACSWQLLQRG